MRIGLYGLPCAGKTYILNHIDFMEVISGSTLLHQYLPDFDMQSEEDKHLARKRMAQHLMTHTDFIMDGHDAFGDTIVFTEQDGQLYDVFLYLYIEPEILRRRMSASDKNKKYLQYDIEKWQKREIAHLRKYCHNNQKDFYVLDNPPSNVFDDVTDIIHFMRAIKDGFSCLAFARQCSKEILRTLHGDSVTLLDGDRTLAVEDTSKTILQYQTNLYDGNFYTGYQTWKQNHDFQNLVFPTHCSMSVCLNQEVLQKVTSTAYILTSGHEKIWRGIALDLGMQFFGGSQMSAETKFFITQELQKAGKKVIAYGDSMNDYYMLKQADEGNLITKPDGTISRSLLGQNMEGLHIVYIAKNRGSL